MPKILNLKSLLIALILGGPSFTFAVEVDDARFLIADSKDKLCYATASDPICSRKLSHPGSALTTMMKHFQALNDAGFLGSLLKELPKEGFDAPEVYRSLNVPKICKDTENQLAKVKTEPPPSGAAGNQVESLSRLMNNLDCKVTIVPKPKPATRPPGRG